MLIKIEKLAYVLLWLMRFRMKRVGGFIKTMNRTELVSPIKLEASTSQELR